MHRITSILLNQSSLVICVGIGALVGAYGDGSDARAQTAEDEAIEEIVVIGSRRGVNSVASSPVPLDFLSGELFRYMGTDDMDDVLRTLIPAYNVQRFPLSDESSLVRPATMRGLPPENTLVLINGKRLHRSAVLAEALGGAQGPDTSVISSTAIDRVEVLRDGASAQYGSDAIAGVINFVMRDRSDGMSLEYQYGQFYAGDGESQRLSFNGGFGLGENGNASVSLEYGNTDKTVCAEQRSLQGRGRFLDAFRRLNANKSSILGHLRLILGIASSGRRDRRSKKERTAQSCLYLLVHRWRVTSVTC